MTNLLRKPTACVVLALATLLAGVTPGCQTASTAREANGPRKRVYRPGQSIAESRLCECRECLEAACCSGDPERDDMASSEPFGLAIATCSRCLKRVWTVRGGDACELLRPRECCPESETG